jgi:hypothetical protein
VSDLAARLRGFDGILVALILVVGYVYVQALRAFVGGMVMPFFARDFENAIEGRFGTLPGGTSHYFVADGRVFYYGGVLEWGLTLALLLLTLVLLDRRLGWRRR